MFWEIVWRSVSQNNIYFHLYIHDDVIKWKHFTRYWPFVRGIHRSPVNSPHKGQWCWALMFSLIRAWINRWVNNRDTGDLRCYRAHYGVIVMSTHDVVWQFCLGNVERMTHNTLIRECVLHTYRLLFWVQGPVCNIGHPFKTDLKSKRKKISLSRDLFIRHPIVFEHYQMTLAKSAAYMDRTVRVCIQFHPVWGGHIHI